MLPTDRQRLFASPIKLANKRVLQPGGVLPPPYEELALRHAGKDPSPIGLFGDVVQGRYASKGSP